MKKIAVIMSGHERMVPWGWRMLQNRFDATLTPVDWHVFSHAWTSSSESQPGRPLREQQLQSHTDHILSSIAGRHVQEQAPMFEPIYQRFLAQGAIPAHDRDDEGFHMPRQTFYRFMGQVMGFCLAMDQWREQLSHMDYIVRSRWDMTVDNTVIDFMIRDHPRRGERTAFYTKAVDIMQGHLEISGDTIYGAADQWLEYFPSTEQCVNRIMMGTRQRWHQVRSQWRNHMRADLELEKYYKTGWWFNSHFIWTTLFLNTSVSLRGMGDSFGISPEVAAIPLDQFDFNHCIMGADWRPNSGAAQQYAHIPIVQQSRKNHTDRAVLQQLQYLRALELERQIKSQSLR